MELEINSNKHGKLIVLYDECDKHVVESHNWYLLGNKWGHVYAITTIKMKKIKLHTLIMGIKGVDHKSGDTLDNRRDNLRICTHQQNMCNRKPQSGCLSKYKGVHFSGKYINYQLVVKGKRYRGYAKTEIEAAKKYNELAIEHHGEFARLNQF